MTCTAPCTAEDIRREHEAAMASLTPEQHRAIERLQRARQRSHFNHLWPTENLEVMFELEAAARCGAVDRAAA